jgi:hypothetical protein
LASPIISADSAWPSLERAFGDQRQRHHAPLRFHMLPIGPSNAFAGIAWRAAEGCPAKDDGSYRLFPLDEQEGRRTVAAIHPFGGMAGALRCD